MIHRISGGLIPETVDECHDITCNRCVHVAYVQRRSLNGAMLIDTRECMHRNLLLKARALDTIAVHKSLLKTCVHVVEAYRVKAENKEREVAVIDLLKSEITKFRHLKTAFGRVWFTDGGRDELWKLPRIEVIGRTVRVGWLYWAVGATRYTV